LFTRSIQCLHPLILTVFSYSLELGEASTKPCKNRKSGWFVHLWNVQESKKKASGLVAFPPLRSRMANELSKARGTVTVPGLSGNVPGAGTDWPFHQFLFFWNHCRVPWTAPSPIRNHAELRKSGASFCPCKTQVIAASPRSETLARASTSGLQSLIFPQVLSEHFNI